MSDRRWPANSIEAFPSKNASICSMVRASVFCICICIRPQSTPPILPFSGSCLIGNEVTFRIILYWTILRNRFLFRYCYTERT